MRGGKTRAAAALAATLALAACAEPPAADRLALSAVSYDDLPGWHEDAAAEALPALVRSCATLAKRAPDASVGRDGTGGVVADWQGPCAAVRRVPAGDDVAARRVLEQWFQPYRAAGDGLFTGYYEVELDAASQPIDRFQHPIHGRPGDLVTVDVAEFVSDWKGGDIVGRIVGGKLKPYPQRRDIAQGALDGAAPVLLWAADPVDVLLLHIQGSGRARLEDGRWRRIGFAASNGHKFVGIGKTLLDKGKVRRDQASMPAIAAWLRAHPDEAAPLIDENPRYIFFRFIDGDGPVGAQGVALTPGRSLAVDPAYVPLGVPIWLDTQDPDGRPLRRLMVAQDTGAAIKGPVRGDFFWGHGPQAFDMAGRMKSRGSYYLLLPRQRSGEDGAAPRPS